MPRKFLQHWVQACEKELSRELPEEKRGSLRGELTLLFLDQTQARKLNRQFRGKDYATDVLSFKSDYAFGELVLCPQVLLRQAVEHGLSFREELGYLVLHGLLHLLGFDHEKGGREAARMYDLQDRLFAVLQKKLLGSAN